MAQVKLRKDGKIYPFLRYTMTICYLVFGKVEFFVLTGLHLDISKREAYFQGHCVSLAWSTKEV